MPSKSSQIISVRAPRTEWERCTRAAVLAGVTRNALVRQAMRDAAEYEEFRAAEHERSVRDRERMLRKSYPQKEVL